MADEKKPTPASVRRENLQPYSESEQDTLLQLVVPQTGRAKIGKDLDRLYRIKYNDGTINQDDSYWDIATSITSDTRLSNLTDKQEAYVQWAIKMQGYCLMLGLPKSASLSDWLRATICEPSLGRGMALRNNLQTVRQKSEHLQVEQTGEKRSLFGFMKNKNRS